MDPNHVFLYMLSNLTPYLASFPLQTPKPSASTSKYHRTWKKSQVEEVFSAATQYCQMTQKSIEQLTLRDFEFISSKFEQSAQQIMSKVNEVHKSGTLRPGIWSPAEDEMLISVLKKGFEKWGQIACLLNREVHKGLKIRNGKQCKERWNNYLNPDVNRGPWTDAEDVIALEKFKVFGNKWSLIAKEIKNRTESSVKNRIKSLLNKIRQDLSAMDDLAVGVERTIVRKRERSESVGMKREEKGE